MEPSQNSLDPHAAQPNTVPGSEGQIASQQFVPQQQAPESLNTEVVLPTLATPTVPTLTPTLGADQATYGIPFQPSAPNTSAAMPVVPQSAYSFSPEPVLQQQASSPIAPPDNYLSNPFLNAVRGLVLTLKTNPKAALICGFINALIILAAYGVSLLLIFIQPLLVIVGIILSVLLAALAIGTFYVIGGASAREEQVTARKAYTTSAKKLLPFILLMVMSSLVILVGMLFLIVPGIILMARSALAPMAMFEENLGPVSALKRSFTLTKGHTNEMLGAIFAGFFIGESYYSLLFGAISVSPMVGRYHDLRLLQDSGAPKPKAHWLNYTYLVGIVAYVLLVGILFTSTYNGVHQKAIENLPNNKTQSFTYP